MVLATAADAEIAEYWDIDGVPLHTFAYSIETQGGTRNSPPPMRGEDITIPHAPGRTWVEKIPDSRVLTLEMWVIGANQDGTINNRSQFERNWRQLLNLFYRPNVQFALTKRFTGIDDSLSLVKATGAGQYSGGLELAMMGERGAKFSVDIFMADPFFYGDVETVSFGPLPSNATKNITVKGDYSTRAVNWHVVGPVSAPQMTLTSVTPNVWMRYGTNVPDGSTTDTDVVEFHTEINDGAGPVASSGYMAHSGSWFWMELPVGAQTLVFSGASGTGTATLSWQPVYW